MGDQWHADILLPREIDERRGAEINARLDLALSHLNSLSKEEETGVEVSLSPASELPPSPNPSRPPQPAFSTLKGSQQWESERKGDGPPHWKAIYGKWRAKEHDHNSGCTDPFCQGCRWKSAPNNSQCYTTNVMVTLITKEHILGVSSIGEVWIHKKYLSTMKKMSPPGIDLRSKSFKMIIMKNAKTLTISPKTPLRCVWIEKNPPMDDQVVIHHPPASLPTMKGAFIYAPVDSAVVNDSNL